MHPVVIKLLLALATWMASTRPYSYGYRDKTTPVNSYLMRAECETQPRRWTYFSRNYYTVILSQGSGQTFM